MIEKHTQWITDNTCYYCTGGGGLATPQGEHLSDSQAHTTCSEEEGIGELSVVFPRCVGVYNPPFLHN